MADPISPPSGLIRILRNLAPIRPDGANTISPHEVLIDSVRKYCELNRVRIDQRPGYSHRIAILIRIGSIRRRNGSAPADMFFWMRGGIGSSERPAIGWLIGIEHLLAGRSKRGYLVPEARAAAVGTRPASAVSQAAGVARPNSGQIARIIFLIRWLNSCQRRRRAPAALCQRERRKK